MIKKGQTAAVFVEPIQGEGGIHPGAPALPALPGLPALPALPALGLSPAALLWPTHNHTPALCLAHPALPAASKAFLEGLRKLCDEADALLVFDEVQVGVRKNSVGCRLRKQPLSLLVAASWCLTKCKVGEGGGLPCLLGALNCQAAGC